eukprot:1718183-Rhodomonas_salina.1
MTATAFEVFGQDTHHHHSSNNMVAEPKRQQLLSPAHTTLDSALAVFSQSGKSKADALCNARRPDVALPEMDDDLLSELNLVYKQFAQQQQAARQRGRSSRRKGNSSCSKRSKEAPTNNLPAIEDVLCGLDGKNSTLDEYISLADIAFSMDMDEHL